MEMKVLCIYECQLLASGIFTCLARLASNIVANENARIDKLYPDHVKALFLADLAPPTAKQ